MLEFIFKEENNLSQNDKYQLEKLLVPLFSFSYHFMQSYKNKRRLYYSSKPKWRLFVKDGDKLIGSLSIVKRRITKPSDLTIGGIGNIGVQESYQKQGIATQMLGKSHAFMTRKHINFSLLFCVERLAQVYTKAGYRRIEQLVTFINENGKKEKEELALFFPISLDKATATSIQTHSVAIGKGTW